MVIKHYSGMISHWPVIWYQVCASRTGHQKISRLSQELQRSIDLAPFTTYLPFCSPMWTWTNRFLFPTHFLNWDSGSGFRLAAILWSFILECDSSSSCCSPFLALVWFVSLSLLILSPFKKPPESAVRFHALLFCNPPRCTRYIYCVLCWHERVNTSNSDWNKRACIHCGKATKAGRLYDKQKSWLNPLNFLLDSKFWLCRKTHLDLSIFLA